LEIWYGNKLEGKLHAMTECTKSGKNFLDPANVTQRLQPCPIPSRGFVAMLFQRILVLRSTGRQVPTGMEPIDFVHHVRSWSPLSTLHYGSASPRMITLGSPPAGKFMLIHSPVTTPKWKHVGQVTS